MRQKKVHFRKNIYLTANNQDIKIEICCDQINSVVKAQALGVDRIELCSGLKLGGLTPDLDLFIQSRTEFKGPIFVLIRPRGGDFHYNEHEKSIILNSTKTFLEHGANGLVVGAQFENKLDVPFMMKLRREFPDTPLTCHRVFDSISDQKEGLLELIEMGYERVLTSGGAPKVDESIHQLQELIDIADSRIGILPGSGITSKNLLQILNMISVEEVHLSGKKLVEKQSSSGILDSSYYELDYIEIQKVMDIARS